MSNIAKGANSEDIISMSLEDEIFKDFDHELDYLLDTSSQSEQLISKKLRLDLDPSVTNPPYLKTLGSSQELRDTLSSLSDYVDFMLSHPSSRTPNPSEDLVLEEFLPDSCTSPSLFQFPSTSRKILQPVPLKTPFIFSGKGGPRLKGYEPVRETLNLSCTSIPQTLTYKNKKKKMVVDLSRKDLDETSKMKRLHFILGPFGTNKQGILKIIYWHISDDGKMSLKKHMAFTGFEVQNERLFFTVTIPKKIPNELRMKIQYALDGTLYYRIFPKIIIHEYSKKSAKRKRM